MMTILVELSADDCEFIRTGRFFPGYFRNPKSYLTGKQHGWLKPGLVLKFLRTIEIEPYSGIYNPTYVGSKGRGKSHGLCTIGAFSYSHSPLPEGMEVGRYCSFATDIRCLDYQHPLHYISSSVVMYRPRSMLTKVAMYELGDRQPFERKPYDGEKNPNYPIIGHDVWIGQDVRMSMGITIGTGAVIAANAVVTRSVPPYAIVAGNPARIKRMRFSEEMIARLIASEWWQYAFTDLKNLPADDVPAFLCQFNAALGKLRPYRPEKMKLPDDLPSFKRTSGLQI